MDRESQTVPEIAEGLNEISLYLRAWLDWDTQHRRKESLTTDDGTQIMSLPVPYWPRHGNLRAWIDIIERGRDALSDGEA